MHLQLVLTSVLSLLALPAQGASIFTPRGVCDPKSSGPLLGLRQEAAIKDFAQIFLVQKDAQKAFDKYVPGEYIQHNPNALSGRQNALDFLIPGFATPGLTISNITVWAGEGIGMMHYRMKSNVFDFAIMDRLKFKGTCINEHWDVLQPIIGNETNPIAFF